LRFTASWLSAASTATSGSLIIAAAAELNGATVLH
jgi:hypothetical protein